MPTGHHPRYRALLWNNDGVLVDTERWYFQATREVLAEIRVQLDAHDYLEYFSRARVARGTSLQRGGGEAEIKALRDERNRRYQRHLETHSLAILGVRETLKALRPQFMMGIVTSSRRGHFETIHRQTGFLEFFDFTLTHDEFTRSKPDAEPYLKAIARTGSLASQCLAIEDAPRGLVAARAGGVDCWVIPTDLSRAADFSAAARILGDVTEVATLLLGELSDS